MIIVTGHLEVAPEHRDALVERSVEAVRSARATDGCLDFAVSADPLDLTRVNVSERWRDRAALDAFRGDGEDAEVAHLIVAHHVVEIDVPNANPAPSGPPHPDIEAEVRAALTERAAAVASKDAVTLASRFSPDLDSFSVLPPFRTHGADELTHGMRAWLDGYEADLRYGIHDLTVNSDADLAVAAFVYEVTGTLTSGETIDMWVRATAVFRRIDDRLQLVHQHESVPWEPAGADA